MDITTEITQTNRFAPSSVKLPEEENKPIIYNHGFSEEQVHTITLAKSNLDKRNLSEFPVTLEEFKTIIIPWQRIKRTEAFNLNPEKPKKEKVIRVPKVKVPKEPKQKKLTKKFINDEMSRIIFKKAMGQELSPDELIFIEAHTQGI